MRSGRQRLLSGDRGGATVEFVLIFPALVVMLLAVTAVGRISLAQQAADSAAYDAARTASLERVGTTAQTKARSAALATFNAQGIKCKEGTNIPVTVNRTGFSVRVGQPATVTVTVVCTLNTSDLLDLPLKFRRDYVLTSTFISPLDTYRSRS